MKKKPHKSLTIQSALVVVLIAVMSLLGFGEGEIAKTFDGLSQDKKADMPIKELLTLIASGGAIYGRYRVKEKDD